jgi:hypothetical protein
MSKKKQDVAVVDNNVPAYLKDYAGPSGAEDIDNDDVSIPRIKLAQGLTPEVKEGTVKDGDLFMNITEEVLAASGESFNVVVVARSKEFILWSPDRSEGILARAKPVRVNGEIKYEWDKQDTDFTVKFKDGPKVTWHTGKYVSDNGMDDWGSKIPDDPDSGIAATAHHNYVVVLPDHGNMVAAMSLSKSQVKRAKDLNALLKLTPAPIFSKLIAVRAVDEKDNEGNDFFNYKFAPAGFVDEAAFIHNKALADSFADTDWAVDQSNNDDGQAAAGPSI